MKAKIHPKTYRKVLFTDATSGERFVLGSTIQTDQKEVVDGVTYPAVKVEISSASHPFYTGKDTMIDTAGRVEKFQRRVAAARKKQ